MNLGRLNKLILFITSVTGVFFASGCGKSDAAPGAAVKLNLTVPGASSLMFNLNPFDLQLGAHDNLQASGTTSQLTSLKYIFGTIMICNDLTVNGSAFSNTSGCVSFYNGPVVGDGSSGQITPATLSTYASSQIDLMSATSRAKINQSASAAAGTYNYAVINWYTPIAINGCAGTGAATVCTRSTGATYATTTTTTTDTLVRGVTADSQEAIVVSGNGGSFFKFQKPFVIAQADIDAGTSFAVDLVFNPDAVIAADSSSNATGNLRGSAGSINVPMLNIAPVPKKASDSTKRESYLAANCGASGQTYRIDLYYSSADSTSILGATGGFIYSGTASSIAQSDLGSKVISVGADTDGSVLLKIPSLTTSKTWETGLKRGVAGTLKLDLDFDGTPETSCAYTFSGTTTI